MLDFLFIWRIFSLLFNEVSIKVGQITSETLTIQYPFEPLSDTFHAKNKLNLLFSLIFFRFSWVKEKQTVRCSCACR